MNAMGAHLASSRAQRLGAEAGGGVAVLLVLLLVEVSDGAPVVVLGAVPLPLIVPLPLTVPLGVVVVELVLLVLVPGLPVVSSRRSQAVNRPIATRTAREAVESIFIETP